MNKIYIVAGNCNEFLIFRRQLADLMTESGISFHMCDFVYVDGIETLVGCRYKPRAYKVGTWSERKDIDDICQFLLSVHPYITEDEVML
jgi:hypothetical protein